MSIKKPVQKNPYIIKGEKKKYAWCACKQTGNPPYCDGTHAKLTSSNEG